MNIHYEKALENVKTTTKQYEETVDKLHHLNKARHDLETKLTDEIERNRSLQEIIRLKEEFIIKR
jgi:chromosome segregation ATPase